MSATSGLPKPAKSLSVPVLSSGLGLFVRPGKPPASREDAGNLLVTGRLSVSILQVAGSRYFCESFYGHPCPTSGKNYATAYAFGGPSRPASLVAYPARGMQHSYAMTRRDFVKPAFSLRSAP